MIDVDELVHIVFSGLSPLVIEGVAEWVFESGVARRVCAGGGVASMSSVWSESGDIRRI